ncbi:MAG TPA: gephyrin-like molybdotransferase Glp [Actinoplanes sp.]|nr:gephyrin-like molybdotransferase Glp [Actinoplanes sp.]
MRSVEEALAAILDAARLTEAETLPLERCFGRVPAAFFLTAAVDVPPFDNSSMDGYALRAADSPGRLRVAGEVAAGAGTLPEVIPGTAARIMTGAPLPPGADAVAPIEVVQESESEVEVPATDPGAYVRRAGHDTRAGESVVLPEEPLTAATIGLLASLGFGELAVRRRPRVAILSTGDELQPPGAPLAAGQIHDANGVALAAAITEAGGEPVPLERTPDDPALIEDQVGRGASNADLLVASGGVSVGRHDHVRDVIERLGTLDFWRIRVQPGKPLAFGAVQGVPVLGLPGNPVSALVTFELFARPLIRGMLGLPGSGRLMLPVMAAERIGKDEDRRAYLRVRVTREADGLAARPAGGQQSSQIRPLANANALLIVPEGEPAAEAGRTYDALLLGAIA